MGICAQTHTPHYLPIQLKIKTNLWGKKNPKQTTKLNIKENVDNSENSTLLSFLKKYHFQFPLSFSVFMFCLPLAVFVSNCSLHPEAPRQWPSFLPLGEVPIVGVAITVSHAGFVPWLWQAHPAPARRLPHWTSRSVGLFCHRSL